MKNIIKIILIVFLPLVLLNSCRNEEDDVFTDAVPSFKLYDPSISSNILYSTMENNPFSLVWDETIGSTQNYKVIFADNADFDNFKVLTTTDKNYYSTTIGNLNTELLKLGLNPYEKSLVFFRIQVDNTAGNTVYKSNSVSLSLTPYPIENPVITSPSSGSSFILDSKNPQALVTKVVWSDYANYGVTVNYLVETALSGTNNFVTLGSASNVKSLDVTNKLLNDAVLKAGAQANVATAIDIRVTATTESTGGTISKVSDIVTITVTPFVAFVNLYLVGDATAAGWNPNNGNQAIFRDPSNTSKFYFTGYYGTSMFKLIEVLGQWQPQWGLKGGVVANSDGGDPEPFGVSSSGYYTFEVDLSTKTYSLTPYTGSMNSYTTIGLIGSATPNGWGGDTLMTQSAFDPHQWSLTGVALAAGEVKFRANSDWGINWGASTEFSGQGTQNGPNIPVAEAGTYNVYFNDIDGRYLLVKQ